MTTEEEARHLPAPVPAGYWLLGRQDRHWRGLAAVTLWKISHDGAWAWRMALSRDAEWSHYLTAKLLPSIPEHERVVSMIQCGLFHAEAAERLTGERS